MNRHALGCTWYLYEAKPSANNVKFIFSEGFGLCTHDCSFFFHFSPPNIQYHVISLQNDALSLLALGSTVEHL